MPTKIIFFQHIFAFYFLKVHLRVHQFYREKLKKKSQSQGFSKFLACWWKDSDPDPDKIMTDPVGPKTSGSTTLHTATVIH
jgi:hypothetical protein